MTPLSDPDIPPHSIVVIDFVIVVVVVAMNEY